MLKIIVLIGVILFFANLDKIIKLTNYIKWRYVDIGRYLRDKEHRFREYGLTMFCGRQGAGKTISMVEYLERMRKIYPNAKIYTNFDYKYQNGQLEGWKSLLYERNENGVIFGIDEIHAEFSSNAWKDFPPELLREISQQRKQKVKIIASAQAFKDVVVQIRRQCFDVVECRTIGERWTFQRCFDAEDYNHFIESNSTPDKKFKVKRKYRRSFVQTDNIRSLYDTYAKVNQMVKLGTRDSMTYHNGKREG